MNEEPRQTERIATVIGNSAFGKTETTDDTLREYPFIVPWTQGDYLNIRYLAACRGKKLATVGVEAIRRGLREMASETVAHHMLRGKPVHQRLALLAQGESVKVAESQGMPPSRAPGA